MAQKYIQITDEEMDEVMKELQLVRMEQKTEKHEITYMTPIPGMDGIELRVFTTIQAGVSRDCGTDAIRIVLFDVSDPDFDRPIGSQGKILRVPGWQDRLIERVELMIKSAFTLKKCPDGHYLVVRTAKAKDTTNVKCPECGANMIVRTARRGKFAGQKFLGCSNFPDCRETLEYTGDEKTGRVSRKKFLGCSHYPQCRYTEEYTGDPTKKDIFKAML